MASLISQPVGVMSIQGGYKNADPMPASSSSSAASYLADGSA
jgi:hypothetical protein